MELVRDIDAVSVRRAVTGESGGRFEFSFVLPSGSLITVELLGAEHETAVVDSGIIGSRIIDFMIACNGVEHTNQTKVTWQK